MTLTSTFAALADPTRRAMVDRLSKGEATVSELAAPHDMSLPAITKHIGVLEGAGLVSRRKEGRTVTCALVGEPLDAAQHWIAEQTRFWSATLDRLDHFVTEEQP